LSQYLKKGYSLWAYREKFSHVELDLVLKSQNDEHLLVLEVKSLSDSSWSEFRLGFDQKKRLKRAYESLILKYSNKEVRFRLLTVQSNKIKEYELDWSEFY